MRILETERLVLRWLGAGDAPFILELVNEPAWLRYIGDRGIRTLEDAQSYIEKSLVEMYRRLGFGLYLVELKQSGVPIGICGLIKRESLENVDLGFAFLSRFWAQGYATESASAVMSYGTKDLGIPRIVAITSQDNPASARLLEKLGFRFERMAQLTAGAAEVKFYASAPALSGEGPAAEGGSQA